VGAGAVVEGGHDAEEEGEGGYGVGHGR
jgi:hypothetical protein